MSLYVAEQIRGSHALVEQLQDACTTQLIRAADEALAPLDRLAHEHEAARLLAEMRRQMRLTVALYSDDSALMAQQLAGIEGDGTWPAFYEQLATLQLRNTKLPPPPPPPAASHVPVHALPVFSSEERAGRHVDLHAQYARYLQLPFHTRCDYLTYLQSFTAFHIVPRERKIKSFHASAYAAYISDVWLYCRRVGQRLHPLVEWEGGADSDSVEGDMRREFEVEWKERRVRGWFVDDEKDGDGRQRRSSGAVSGSARVDESKEGASSEAQRDPLFCRACKKLFAKQSVFDAHLSGRKHVKAQAELDALSLHNTATATADSTASSTPSATPATTALPASVAAHLQQMHDVALVEYFVQQYAQLLDGPLQATIAFQQHKLTLTPAELQQEIAHTLQAATKPASTALILSSLAGNGGGAAMESDDELAPSLANPKHLPLGVDGKPIPYWVYKLQGLNHFFDCEVCGSYKYRGPREYAEHFSGWRHAWGMKCLTGDHMVLTSSGFRSIKSIAVNDVVASINVDMDERTEAATCAFEWRRVTDTQCFDAAAQPLYRMEGAGMDLIATADHSMLLARFDNNGLQKSKPYGYESVAKVRLELTYATAHKSTVSCFTHNTAREVIRSAINLQPAWKLIIPGLEAVCEWWWKRDRQLSFLRFFGFWLGDGQLDVSAGWAGVSQRKGEGVAWVRALLDEVFPRCWYCNSLNADGKGITYNFIIRCPPLYEWLRCRAAGPLGYDPLNPKALRRYPHFDFKASLAAEELKTRYHSRSRRRSNWTEREMLAAMRSAHTAPDRCWWCDGSESEEGNELLLCDGCPRGGHLYCSGLTAVPEGEWRCPTCAPSPDQASAMQVEVEVEVAVAAVAAVSVACVQVVWNNGAWDIDINGDWFDRKRWMGFDVASTFSRLSQRQAVSLLEGFCRADGRLAAVQFDELGDPVGCWKCSGSSFPLIDHLQLISQLAGASVDLSLHSPAGTISNSTSERPKQSVVDEWLLAISWLKAPRAPVHTALLARPVDVSADVAGRGYYEYEDDGKVYDITVEGNHNFLTQRLSMKRVQADGGGVGLRAQPVFTGNCLGVPNARELWGVTRIEEVKALWEKMKQQEDGKGWRDEDEEEMEDNEGNVFNKKTYLELQRQGLI